MLSCYAMLSGSSRLDGVSACFVHHAIGQVTIESDVAEKLIVLSIGTCVHVDFNYTY